MRIPSSCWQSFVLLICLLPQASFAGKLVAIGDIHGAYDELVALLCDENVAKIG